MNDSAFPGQMEQFDQLNIETPEQVDLRLPIAGIGSRFLAILTDTAIQVVAEVLLVLLFLLFASASQRASFEVSDTAGKWFVAAMVLFNFLLYWGYFAVFEAYWNGQTPGKKLVKVRVIKDSGRQITLFEALARNLLRVVDMIPPSLYFVGVVSMLCNRQQKRLGDFVAGTIVVHERMTEQPLPAHNSRSFTASIYAPAPELAANSIFKPAVYTLPADAVARLSVDDLHVIESFLGRALDFDLATRAAIVQRIAGSMFAKMGLPLPEGSNLERTLEAMAYAMRAQGRV